MEVAESEEMKLRPDETELDFIYRKELRARTRLIKERDQVSTNRAQLIARKWIADEIENTQLDLLPDSREPRYYRAEYIRQGHSVHDDYYVANLKVHGKLYNWQSTNEVLAEIIRNKIDNRCERVVVIIENTIRS